MAERPPRVSYTFIKTTPSDKCLFGDNVIAMMTEHASVFPTPDIPLPVLQAALDDLRLKIQLASGGDKAMILARNASEKQWDSLFRKQGQYVERIAEASKLIMTQGGYHSVATEVQPLSKPGMPMLQAWGNKAKGSIHAQIKPLANTRGIVFMVSTVPFSELSIRMNSAQLDIVAKADAHVTFVMGTKRKVDFQGLRTGQIYYVAAFGFNAGGMGDMKPAVDVTAP